MAKITLSNLRHSYLNTPTFPEDYALKDINLECRDGGAYALLGPSGCGKSTLLNIISGLLIPSDGQVLFDGGDVTNLPPDRRNIAQVFQFPVIYDTMTVFDNLAFPLRNLGVKDVDVLLRVREDVNIVMFDEPLTVIAPHQKRELRSKPRELHHEVRATMIYVTHDQTEALTFADQVVAMQEGEIVQIGTPVELFERPKHNFVGHFIGSPGMNVLPCELRDGAVIFEGHRVALEGAITSGTGAAQIGIRPEFVSLADTGLPAVIRKVSDVGRYNIVEAMVGNTRIKAIVAGAVAGQGAQVSLAFQQDQTRLYRDGWIATEAAQGAGV